MVGWWQFATVTEFLPIVCMCRINLIHFELSINMRSVDSSAQQTRTDTPSYPFEIGEIETDEEEKKNSTKSTPCAWLLFLPTVSSIYHIRVVCVCVSVKALRWFWQCFARIHRVHHKSTVEPKLAGQHSPKASSTHSHTDTQSLAHSISKSTWANGTKRF